MKEVKDLLFLDLDNEHNSDEKESKKEELEQPKLKEQEQEIDIKDIKYINENEIEENEVIEESKIRKYFKYEDGKIKYFSLFNKGKLKKEGFSLKDVKENIKNEIKVEKKRLDKRDIVNKLFIVFILFFIAFTYFYYFKDSSIEIGINDGKVLEDIDNGSIKDNSIANSENKKEKDAENITKDDLISNIESNIKLKNTSEVKKINDYLDIKGNRVSTNNLIKGFKEDKENIYKKLILNKELFNKDEDAYFELEELIIKSIAMSEEFLITFDEGGNKNDFKDLINKYKNK